jgi:cell division protein FtsL
VEQLENQRAQVAQLNQQLHLEVATLRSPMRVDSIARNQLGLTVPVPGQVAPVEAPSDAVLAQARVLQTTRP